MKKRYKKSFIIKKLYPICLQISHVKRLSKILYNLIEDSVGDIDCIDVATLSHVLNNEINRVSSKLEKLEIYLGM